MKEDNVSSGAPEALKVSSTTSAIPLAKAIRKALAARGAVRLGAVGARAVLVAWTAISMVDGVEVELQVEHAKRPDTGEAIKVCNAVLRAKRDAGVAD